MKRRIFMLLFLPLLLTGCAAPENDAASPVIEIAVPEDNAAAQKTQPPKSDTPASQPQETQPPKSDTPASRPQETQPPKSDTPASQPQETNPTIGSSSCQPNAASAGSGAVG